MNKFLTSIALVLLVPAAAFACEGEETAAVEGWTEVSVEQLASMLEEGTATAVDANRGETRQNVGIIPGAILLAGSEYDTDVLASAGEGDALVFYCYNERCGASHRAADAALAAGYGDVHVLPAGIMGWVESGHEVDPPAIN